MLELILTFCLIADANVCKDVRQPVADQAVSTPYQCAKFGQQKAVEWLADKPTWRVARIACRPGHEPTGPKIDA